MNLGQAQPDQIQGGKDLGKKASLWPFTSVWHLLPTGCRDFAQGLYCPHHAMNAKAPSFFLLPGILHLVYKSLLFMGGPGSLEPISPAHI